MAETKEADAGAAPAVADPVDELASSAAGLRATSQWIAAAFAGIPSLAVVGALVRAPGDAGFDDAYLVAGVLLAALGALIGILAFARVREPLGLHDGQIDDDVLKRLPESRYGSYDKLSERLELQRDLLGDKRVPASDAAGEAKAAEAIAVQAEAAAKLADELVRKDDGPESDRALEAKAARQVAREARAAAGLAAATAAVHEQGLELDERLFESLVAQRRSAYAVQASETVRKRYEQANAWAGAAVLLVALGVIFLALAPKPKAEAKSAQPTLVRLGLSEAGQQALGCEAEAVDALKLGGDDKSLDVIVLPGGGCQAQTVKFVTEDPAPLGEELDVKTVPAK
jgi:hypothetical protein